jgi:hypothetical protein
MPGGGGSTVQPPPPSQQPCHQQPPVAAETSTSHSGGHRDKTDLEQILKSEILRAPFHVRLPSLFFCLNFFRVLLEQKKTKFPQKM